MLVSLCFCDVVVECDYFHCCWSRGELNLFCLRLHRGGAVMWLSSALSYHFEAVEIVHCLIDPRLHGLHYVESDGFLRYYIVGRRMFNNFLCLILSVSLVLRDMFDGGGIVCCGLICASKGANADARGS
ncbi:hypothetical protein TSUD_272190 [Trifolium subterraneum]|uniref:Uncharacterized protein n=1 Tax=Trifolium subterraneum TaxID=3900 RepID=A0A2Z6NV15_TRISU|nr:hypothetical protein TSUD_272190 [Trifolium subterraneum]